MIQFGSLVVIDGVELSNKCHASDTRYEVQYYDCSRAYDEFVMFKTEGPVNRTSCFVLCRHHFEGLLGD